MRVLAGVIVVLLTGLAGCQEIDKTASIEAGKEPCPTPPSPAGKTTVRFDLVFASERHREPKSDWLGFDHGNITQKRFGSKTIEQSVVPDPAGCGVMTLRTGEEVQIFAKITGHEPACSWFGGLEVTPASAVERHEIELRRGCVD